MKHRNNFTEYVYLEALDSVKTSEDEQKEAEKQLFRSLVFEGKIVVLTYNQIIDSITFLHCIRNKQAFDTLLNFFKQGRLLINQYGDDMNLSYFIQKNYHANTFFLSSYFTFLNNYSEEDKNIIYDGIHNSIRYGDTLYLKKIMPLSISEEDQTEIYQYITFLLTINSYIREYKCYVKPKCNDELNGHRMNDYLKQISEILLDLYPQQGILLQDLIKHHKDLNKKDSRSQYFELLHKESTPLYKQNKQFLETCINLAYNKAMKYSISTINPLKLPPLKDELKKRLYSMETNDKPSVYQVNAPWSDGYRITMICAYLYEHTHKISWKYLLYLCPLLDLFRLLLSLIIALCLMLIIDLLTSPVSFDFSNILTFIIVFLYSYTLDIISDWISDQLPKWMNIPAYQQIKHAIKDSVLILTKGKHFYE